MLKRAMSPSPAEGAQDTRPLCRTAPVLSLLLPWLNSRWIHPEDKRAPVRTWRGSNVPPPLPHPTTPPQTQQNTSNLHTHRYSMVTANKHWQGRARDCGRGLSRVRRTRAGLLLPRQCVTRQEDWARGRGTSTAGTPQGDVHWKHLSLKGKQNEGTKKNSSLCEKKQNLLNLLFLFYRVFNSLRGQRNSFSGLRLSGSNLPARGRPNFPDRHPAPSLSHTEGQRPHDSRVRWRQVPAPKALWEHRTLAESQVINSGSVCTMEPKDAEVYFVWFSQYYKIWKCSHHNPSSFFSLTREYQHWTQNAVWQNCVSWVWETGPLRSGLADAATPPGTHVAGFPPLWKLPGPWPLWVDTWVWYPLKVWSLLNCRMHSERNT